MILYPIETIYALGVNALDEASIVKLFELKGRTEGKSVSWLVRDIVDIERWGVVMGSVAAKIAEQFLPGPLTLVLQARDSVARPLRGTEDSVSFRISPDPVAQKAIADFMVEHDAPLTCTSANVSGMTPGTTPAEILEQFVTAGRDPSVISQIIDDGPRSGEPSTVVRIIDDVVDILREGAISEDAILSKM